METPSAKLIRLPEHLSRDEARALAPEIDRLLLVDQPCVVIDFSRVKQIDSSGLNMLLQCMVEIAKRDGALQLGGISPEAATLLEITRMDWIFDMFPRISDENMTLSIVPAQTAEQVEVDAEDKQGSSQEPQPVAA